MPVQANSRLADSRIAVQDGHVEDALAALTEHLRAKKDDHKSRALLAEILLQQNRLDEARSALADAPADAAELKSVRALLAFAGRAQQLPELAALEARMQGSPDTATRYQYAVRLITVARLEEGMDLLLDIFRRDRQFDDDIARKTLLEVFEMLGRDDPLAAQYRRRLANYLY